MTRPSKYFFNVATPELIHNKVGSSTGTSEALGSTLCPFDLKKSKYIWRICAPVNDLSGFMNNSSLFLNETKKKRCLPLWKGTKASLRGTTLVRTVYTVPRTSVNVDEAPRLSGDSRIASAGRPPSSRSLGRCLCRGGDDVLISFIVCIVSVVYSSLSHAFGKTSRLPA